MRAYLHTVICLKNIYPDMVHERGPFKAILTVILNGTCYSMVLFRKSHAIFFLLQFAAQFSHSVGCPTCDPTRSQVVLRPATKQC